MGFQDPEGVADGGCPLRRRRRESRKKTTLAPPRMTTPESSALVTGFIGSNEPLDAAEITHVKKKTRKMKSFFNMKNVI